MGIKNVFSAGSKCNGGGCLPLKAPLMALQPFHICAKSLRYAANSFLFILWPSAQHFRKDTIQDQFQTISAVHILPLRIIPLIDYLRLLSKPESLITCYFNPMLALFLLDYQNRLIRGLFTGERGLL